MTTNTNDADIVNNVTSTVKRLTELTNRLRSAGVSFKDEDINHIDQVIETLQELDLDRVRAQEAYEIETIKASALRHKLMRYPREINDEIQGAIKAARGLNEDTINQLRAQLQEILDTIAELTARFEELDAANAVLMPQRDAIKLEHEEVIAELNQRLSQKAGQQIDLNETRNHVRECNKKIVDLEEDIVQLKEDLVQERATAREEKKMLNKETTQTIEAYSEQRDRNAERKQTLDGLQHNVTELELRMEDFRSQIASLDVKIGELQTEEQSLQENLESQCDENERLRLKGMCFREEKEKLAEEFAEHKKQVLQKIRDVEASVEKMEKKQVVLKEKKAELEEEVDIALKTRESDAKKVKELNDILQDTKIGLAAQAEDCGRLQQEITEMEERKVNIAETHQSTVSMLNKQIAELKDQLTRERQERIEMQADKDVLQKEIDAFRQKHSMFIKETNKQINEGKSEHTKLTKEQQTLTKNIKDSIQLAERLDAQLKSANKSYEEMKVSLGGRATQLQTEIETMQRESGEKETEIENRLPEFREFEAYFNKHTAEYDELKKRVVKMKNQKTSLEESVNRTKKEIAKQEGPLAELRAELDRKQEQVRTQLTKHADERMSHERNIYVLGCKLKTAEEENTRFKKGIELMEKQIRKITTEWQNALKIKARTQQAVDKEKGILNEGWREDKYLAARAEEHDQDLLELLGDLLERTDDRERLISGVTHRLQAELEGLTEFLENIGSRRRAGAKTERGGESSFRILRHVKAIRTGLGAIHGVARANEPPSEKPLHHSCRP